MNDDETWVEGDHANTLNSFDAGDVRTTHAVLAAFYSTGGSQQGFARTDGVSPTLKIGSSLDIASPVAIVGDSYYVEDCENAALRANGANDGPPRTDKHPLVVEEQMSVRRLTPTECERLMGWPDEWTAPEGVKAPDSKRYAACGDGIVAPVAFWIADRIRMIEGEA
jgi:DNA (cytosine-5)-methyltransferase 1